MPAPNHPNLRLCAYTKVDGYHCGGAAVTNSEFCRHHDNLKTSFEKQMFSLPALDDANSIQVAAMQVINALITGRVSRPDAYAIFYGLHLAKSNLKGTTLSPPAPDELADKLEQARKQGYAEGIKASKEEEDRAYDERSEADKDTLFSYLLREMKENDAEAAEETRLRLMGKGGSVPQK